MTENISLLVKYVKRTVSQRTVSPCVVVLGFVRMFIFRFAPNNDMEGENTNTVGSYGSHEEPEKCSFHFKNTTTTEIYSTLLWKTPLK